MRFRPVLVVCAALALSVGAATAAAGDGHGNSEAAKACQKGGWQNWVREDGTGFKNQGDCVAYAAQGGTLQPPCTAGSENFSEFTSGAPGDTPTTFSGGTIDTSYGGRGGVYQQVPPGVWAGGFPDGTYLLFSGFGVNSFQLTFTNPVASISLDSQSEFPGVRTETLTAYDSSATIVDSNSLASSSTQANTLTVTSSSANIKYFTIATDDVDVHGIGFTNIVWGCS